MTVFEELRKTAGFSINVEVAIDVITAALDELVERWDDVPLSRIRELCAKFGVKPEGEELEA